MSTISRHQAGTQIAGRKTGGQFKAAERTHAGAIPDGAAVDLPPRDVPAASLAPGDPVDVTAIWSREYDAELYEIAEGGLTVANVTVQGRDVFVDFEETDHSASFDIDTPIPVRDRFAGFRKDWWEDGAYSYSDDDPADYTPAEAGLENFGITLISASGNPETGEGVLTADLHENVVASGCLTQEQFDLGYRHLVRVMREEYGAEELVGVDEDGVLGLEFSVDLRHEPTMSAGKAGDLLWEKSQLVRFHNETDRGTYGSPYIYDRIGREIDAGFFPNPQDGTRESVEKILNASRQDRARMAEVSERFPQLHELIQHGYCTDAAKALKELDYATGPEADDLKAALRRRVEG